MFRGKGFFACLFAVLLLFVSFQAFAQEVQKVTITVAEPSEDKFTQEPKEVIVRPGKVEFTLVNKGAKDHSLAVKMGEKEIRLVRVATPGKSAKGEPVDISAGEYEIYCTRTSGGSHKNKGMVGKLIVK